MNAYLQKRETERRIWVEAAQRSTEQFLADTLQITLHQKRGWGYDRIVELCNDWHETIVEYSPCTNSKDPECDVYREHMDRVLSQIIKDKQKLLAWDERYPELSKVRYSK